MNEFSNSRPIDDVRFDRLVDGELSPDEYRSLLASLDDEPGGWRRCALAFLEAQALGQELGAIRRESPGPNKDSAAATNGLHRPAAARLRGVTLTLAAAASLLMAFGLGLAAPWFAGRLQTISLKPAPATGSPASDLPSPVAVPVDEAVPRSPRPVERVRLVVDGPGGKRVEAGEVPVYDVAGDAAAWLQPAEPALSVELIDNLTRRGHQVQRQQQWVPVDLGDGRQGIIPVEGYQITPVSRRTY